jgi:hypothetical protein
VLIRSCALTLLGSANADFDSMSRRFFGREIAIRIES